MKPQRERDKGWKNKHGTRPAKHAPLETTAARGSGREGTRAITRNALLYNVDLIMSNRSLLSLAILPP